MKIVIKADMKSKAYQIGRMDEFEMAFWALSDGFQLLCKKYHKLSSFKLKCT